MDREEAIKLFREMWSDLYEEIVNRKEIVSIYYFKEIWLDARFFGKDFMSNCPLCEYAFVTKNSGCCKCPIVWNYNESIYCHNSVTFSGLYDLAVNALTWQEQAEIVKLISELPEKD